MDADCKASCLDWYGNARPLFIGNRVFASLGYELVQGSIEGGHIREPRITLKTQADADRHLGAKLRPSATSA
jgi:hypothetical protein